MWLKFSKHYLLYKEMTVNIDSLMQSQTNLVGWCQAKKTLDGIDPKDPCSVLSLLLKQ